MPSCATLTTWLLVRIRPSSDNTMPEPSSEARPILVSSFTTLGTTFAATCSTEPTGTLAVGTARPFGAAVAIVVVGPLCGCDITATMPPIPADTAAIASAPTVSATGRDRFRAGAPATGGRTAVFPACAAR